MIDLFETQREMRHRRAAAMKRGVMAVLDVGSYKISCLVMQFAEEEPQAGMPEVTVPRMAAFGWSGLARCAHVGSSLAKSPIWAKPSGLFGQP